MKISSLSREYVRCPISATEAGVTVNPSVDTVVMAFTLDGAEPAAADWKAATWETAGTTYYARCLVGPGGTVVLPDGVYTVWVKVTDNPEVPVLRAGRALVVT